MQSADDSSLLGRFDPGRCHQQVADDSRLRLHLSTLLNSKGLLQGDLD